MQQRRYYHSALHESDNMAHWIEDCLHGNRMLEKCYCSNGPDPSSKICTECERRTKLEVPNKEILSRESLQEHFEQFESEWADRLGQTGRALRNDLQKLTDLILLEAQDMLDECIKARVASWALTDSEETIPMEKFSKEGVLRIASNREVVSDGELLELVRQRFNFQ